MALKNGLLHRCQAILLMMQLVYTEAMRWLGYCMTRPRPTLVLPWLCPLATIQLYTYNTALEMLIYVTSRSIKDIVHCVSGVLSKEFLKLWRGVSLVAGLEYGLEQ